MTCLLTCLFVYQNNYDLQNFPFQNDSTWTEKYKNPNSATVGSATIFLYCLYFCLKYISYTTVYDIMIILKILNFLTLTLRKRASINLRPLYCLWDVIFQIIFHSFPSNLLCHQSLIIFLDVIASLDLGYEREGLTLFLWREYKKVLSLLFIWFLMKIQRDGAWKNLTFSFYI